ncbi:4'-phosphopantetheinyl transferase family protein [Streptomyces abyssomicinicus]|uniref:4'-phosphopantetheinyl transferase family protein n=1 Tax=Streptomyces abyssomicinicus TaxID=574929 RepID=UPI00124FA9AD|nr:4'-phosphopantetheinyl transferase superfamily protein [Streptomyces abyssomicinicus]
MMRDLLPPAVHLAESFGDLPEAVLLPEEEPAIARAVEKRRREYTTVRHLARRALGCLGHGGAALPPGELRAPRWPSGVVGSMTHCEGYRAAAAADAALLASVGIDAEPHEPLPPEVLGGAALPEEREHLAGLARLRPETHWDRVLFSAKESVYKAWYPLTGAWLGFEDAVLAFDPSGTFRARVLPGALVEGGPAAFDGRWSVADGFVTTAVVVDGGLPVDGAGPTAASARCRCRGRDGADAAG